MGSNVAASHPVNGSLHIFIKKLYKSDQTSLLNSSSLAVSVGLSQVRECLKVVQKVRTQENTTDLDEVERRNHRWAALAATCRAEL